MVTVSITTHRTFWILFWIFIVVFIFRYFLYNYFGWCMWLIKSNMFYDFNFPSFWNDGLFWLLYRFILNSFSCIVCFLIYWNLLVLTNSIYARLIWLLIRNISWIFYFLFLKLKIYLIVFCTKIFITFDFIWIYRIFIKFVI